MTEVVFPVGSVPVATAAKVYGKPPHWIRAGLIEGWLPIGTAIRNGEQVLDISDQDSSRGRINYYISPKLLYEQTGYLWEGKETYIFRKDECSMSDNEAYPHPELSRRSKYYVPRERYYELKHFCRQYPDWVNEYRLTAANLTKKMNDSSGVKGTDTSRPTESHGARLAALSYQIEMIDTTVKETDPTIQDFLKMSVTKGLSYDCLKTKYDIPMCRDSFYDRYRKFFWILSHKR